MANRPLLKIPDFSKIGNSEQHELLKRAKSTAFAIPSSKSGKLKYVSFSEVPIFKTIDQITFEKQTKEEKLKKKNDPFMDMMGSNRKSLYISPYIKPQPMNIMDFMGNNKYFLMKKAGHLLLPNN